MAEALRLAELGAWTTHPNPRVGCVIADGAAVVGRGWHERAGGPHAEVVALADAGERARGATAYVTLEPCAHHGRTPPCADALLAAGIARVVAAVPDPFPEVDGRGFGKLRAGGVVVEVGLLRPAGEALIRGFLSRVQRGRPWVRVKLAMSLDARTALADGESRWISSGASRADVQRLRARASAILTASGTVLRDDPRLNVRIDTPRQPHRYVIDTELQTPATAQVLTTGATTLVVADDVDPPAWTEQRGVTVLHAPRAPRGLDLAAVLRLLADRGENELHVEAGAGLCGGLATAGLIDELVLYVAPHLLGPGRPLLQLPALESMGDRMNWRFDEVRHVGEDLRITCSPESSRP
ncbi:MAG: bifunctional diaminohydroxyphosphoribosylaminopyrimidine deaminase/5-amino-6-(5-phosphoribosylamino)uracil reductase RibD [Pseudomonadota bacterium]